MHNFTFGLLRSAIPLSLTDPDPIGLFGHPDEEQPRVDHAADQARHRGV